MCAVELSMRSVNARVAFCQLLWKNLVPINRATLFPQQFELIVRLMNCALNVHLSEKRNPCRVMIVTRCSRRAGL